MERFHIVKTFRCNFYELNETLVATTCDPWVREINLISDRD
jgi:hypothetical protein